ncbi:uncharacterized protein [Clytia hemisphaerica]|uniref:uncharacterized protein n=1 Tax=Clytia hemisphaerica TaxID=252671 RepID=UPI0034D71079
MTEEEKIKIKARNRISLANARANLTEEQKREKREKDRSRKAKARANLTEEQKREKIEKDRSRKAKARANLTEEQKREKIEKDRSRKAKARANLTEKQKKAAKEKDRKRKKESPHENNMVHRVKTFKKEIRKGPFFICVICNRLMYRLSVVLFNQNKYHDVDENVFSYRVLSFDGKEYICNTCHKKMLKKKIPAQAVANDLQMADLPERFSDIRKLEKIIIAKRLLFKRITIMSKGQAPKMKGAICNVPIKADDICNILPRGMDNNGVVRVALKKKMSFKSNVYFEPVRPQFVREVLIYLRNNNPLYSDIEINVDSIPACWIGSINNDDQDETDDEIDFVREGISEDTKHAEIEEEEGNPLDHLRIPASETVFVPELPNNIVDDSNVTIAPGEDKKPLPIICDKDCEMLAHPHLFPTGQFGYSHERGEKLSPTRYFNQRLLNYSLKFSSDSDYIFYAQSLLQHLNLNNSINTALKKIQTEGLTAGQLSQNFKETISDLVANDNAYSFMNNLKDKGFQIHYKRSTAACFVNNYFEEGLRAWEANMDLQPVLDYHRCVSYMCAYISKSEDESTEAMKQAAKEALESNQSLKEKMKSISRAYRTHREMSIQEAVSIVLPEIWLRKTSPAVIFANSNLPENRYRVCKSQDEISKMDENDTNVFKRNMLDRYLDRPTSSCYKRKYPSLEHICYAEFMANYTLDSKNKEIENDYQPEILEEIEQTEAVDLRLPSSFPLKSNSKERLKLRKTKCVLRYHVPSREKKPEKYAHHLLFMFYPFRDEQELKGPQLTYTEKLLSPEVLQIVNRNKAIFEPFADVVEDAMLNFHENPRGFDIYGEQENDEVRQNNIMEEETDDEMENDNDYHGGVSVQTIEPLISDEELNIRIRSLNDKQRELFDFVVRWSRQSFQQLRTNTIEKPNPFYIFLTGSAGCGKSYTLNTIKFYLQKSLTYGARNAAKERLLIMAPTGVAAVNVTGSTLNSTLSIPSDPRYEFSKIIPKLSSQLTSKFRERLSELRVIIIDEISMVSKFRLLHINQRLCEIFDTDIPFSGIPIITCGDFYQLPPIKGGQIFSLFEDRMLNIDHLWRKFRIVELMEVMRQRGDQVFIDILNNIRVGVVEENDLEILSQRIVTQNDPCYPKDAIHLWAENKPVDNHNKLKLNELPGEEIEVVSVDKFPRGISNADMTSVYNRGQMQTGGLAHKFIFKFGAKVMVTSNIDVEDKLCNGQIGTIQYIKFDTERKVKRIYLKMESDDIGIKAKTNDTYGRANNLVPIEKVEKEFGVKTTRQYPSVKRIQFPLMLSWACTVHKVQGKTFSQIVFNMNLFGQRAFKPGQVYVALSRVTTLQGLYLVGTLRPNIIKCDEKATDEYNQMRTNLCLDTNPNLEKGESDYIMSLINVRSLHKHAADVVSDKILTGSSIICMTETQLTNGLDTSQIKTSLKPFSLYMNNTAEHKYSNTAIAYNERTELLDTYNIPGATQYTIMDEVLQFPINTILLYRQQNLANDHFLYMIQHLQGTVDKVHIILGDFNKNYFTEESNFLKTFLQDYEMIVKKPTHVSGSLIDHVYIHKDLLSIFKITTSIHSIYYSDHEAIQIIFRKLGEK